MVLALLLVVGCHRDRTEAPPFLDPDGAEAEVSDEGVITLRAPGGVSRQVRVALGFVSSPSDTVNYDPYNLKDPDLAGEIPSGLDFLEPSRATLVDSGDANVWELDFDGEATATLTLDPDGPGLRFRLLQGAGEPWAPYARVRVDVEPQEGFYGLGETFGAVQQRGRIEAMQIELRADMESSNNEAHAPVPLLVSDAGWGLLADSYWPGVFDVAATDPDVVEAIFNQRDGFTFDLYAPNSPPAVVARYHQRTGAPELPPTWAYAPMQWRNEVAGTVDVLADLAAIRANHIPTGLIWVDNPWQTTYNSMQPDPAMFPDWEGLVDTLHAAGFRVMAWTTPYVEDADPEHDRYEAEGWFVDAPILFSDFGDWVDLTNPDAAAAWQGRVSAAADRGIEGWKLDYGEDTQLGYGRSRFTYLFANGEDERTMHHRYATYFHRAYGDAYPDQAGFLLGRAGVLGGHTITDCIWPGDLDSDFSRFGDVDAEDGETRVGGLPSAIRGGTSLSISGYPFFASDTGGFRRGRPTAEVMVRWAEYSALLPIMQYGGGGENHNPWDFTAYGDSQFDQSTLDAFVRMAQLHIRLFPYFWRLSERVRDEGLPIVLPPGMAFPGSGNDADDVFMVGDDILVAPVETEGATSRAVLLPPGDWVHWWTGQKYDGDVVIDVAAPLGLGPVFQRAGSAIPMLRRSVETLSPSDGSVDSWADDPGALNARIVPGSGAAFTLSSGEAVRAEGDILLTPGTLYTGWDLEIWAPGATGATVDGVALPVGVDGCTNCVLLETPWARVVTDAGATVVVY